MFIYVSLVHWCEITLQLISIFSVRAETIHTSQSTILPLQTFHPYILSCLTDLQCSRNGGMSVQEQRWFSWSQTTAWDPINVIPPGGRRRRG